MGETEKDLLDLCRLGGIFQALEMIVMGMGNEELIDFGDSQLVQELSCFHTGALIAGINYIYLIIKAEDGGIGIADMMYKQLKPQVESRNAAQNVIK